MRIRKIYLDDTGDKWRYEMQVQTARGEKFWKAIPDFDQRGVYVDGLLMGPGELRRLADFYTNGGMDAVCNQLPDGSLNQWDTRAQDFVPVEQ